MKGHPVSLRPSRRLLRRLRASLQVEALESRLTPATARVAVIGDYGVGGSGEGQVSTLVHGWSPDAIITLGDNNYPSGTAATIDKNIGQFYHDFIGNYTGTYGAGSATNRFFPALGAHDWDTTSGSPPLPTPYLNYVTLPGNERYYTFTDGPVQFFCVDSGDGSGTVGQDGFDPDGKSATSIQGQWLQSQLAASTAPFKVVYFHHPPYSSSYFGDTAIMQWPFQQWGATAVLSGHDHDYERFNFNGFPYFVNGVGGESYVAFTRSPEPGSQVQYASNFGAMRIDATDTQCTFQFINVAGTVIDTYTVNAGTPPPSTVSIAATDASASEQTPTDTGTFTVTRTGSTTSALTVNVFLSGTAINGSDYTSIPNTVTIPAGSASATVTVKPINDGQPDGNESVEMTVVAGTGYTIGSSDAAVVTIHDTTGPSTTLLSAGTVWKYLDDGSNQGTAWQASGFNDSAWKSGQAELGYGDGDEATVVGFGPNAGSKYITTYFRQAFTVTNPGQYGGLTLHLLRDDGAVVYLNGVEVYRNNMPTGAITYTTLAGTAIGGTDETTFVTTTLNPASLVNGTNVFAVEIHQAAPDSSDISFNMELDASTAPPPPAPSTPALAPASDSGIANNDNYTKVTTPTFSGTAQAGTTVSVYSDGTLVGTGTATSGAYSITTSALANGTHAITATATNSFGGTSPASGPLSVTIDTVIPTATITPVTPSPRTTAVSSLTIVFSEPSYGLTLAGLKLALNAGSNLLTGSQTLTTADNITWTLGNLSGLTGTIGSYTLTLTAAGSGVTDKAGNALAANASTSWQVSPPAPSTPVLTAASDSGVANNDNYTNVTTPTFTGTATAGTTVKIYSDGVQVGSGTATGGAYSITTSALAGGTHAITATATDPITSLTSPASAALSVTIDTVSPTAMITAVSPNPRTTAVGSMTIVFSEPSFGLTLTSLILSFDSGSNLLTASQILSTSDNVTWTLGNLSGLTGAIGNYSLTLTAAGSGVTDKAGNALAGNAATSWKLVPPAPSTPDLADASDSGVSSTDNVTNVTTPTFTGTASTGMTVNIFSDGTLVGIGTAANGAYSITTDALTGGTHAITATAVDPATANSSALSGTLSVTIDTASPTVSITAVTPNPRTTAVGSMTIVFNEPSFGLTLTSLSLTFNDGSNLLTGSQTLTTSDNVTWTLGNLSAITGAVGGYSLTLTAAGSGVTDKAGNALASGANTSWQTQGPPIIIDDGDAGFAVVGSWKSNGQGFQGDSHNTGAGSGSKNATWRFTGLQPGTYRVSATWPSGGNRAGNAPFSVLQGSTVLGSVTVNQKQAPSGFSDSGGKWQDLGGPYQVTGTTLTVKLTDNANGTVVADAIRIQLLTPASPAATAPASSGNSTGPGGSPLDLTSLFGPGSSNPTADTPLNPKQEPPV
jgi:hypothetical protein